MKCLLTNFDECLAGGQGAPTQENGILPHINSNKGNSMTIDKAAQILGLEVCNSKDVFTKSTEIVGVDLEPWAIGYSLDELLESVVPVVQKEFIEAFKFLCAEAKQHEDDFKQYQDAGREFDSSCDFADDIY